MLIKPMPVCSRLIYNQDENKRGNCNNKTGINNK